MSAHAPDHAAHAPGMHVAHISSAGTLAKVLVALLFLTIITVAVSRVNFGAANLAIAMVIAAVKVSLVLIWFMHLKNDTAVNALFMVSSFLFLSLLFLFTLADHSTRGAVDRDLVRTAPVNKTAPH